MVFLTNRGMDRLPRGDNEYRAFNSKVKSKQGELKYMKNTSVFKKGKSGKGYSGKNASVFKGNFQHDSQTCPGNILNDISRLEVLIGGR